jgi:16S rRNA (cytosine1402-N4)-methyltransferase|tara:strand:+ start:13 stop:918 length:906 start_codon:yes stop_codon:yes gene_type:complete
MTKTNYHTPVLLKESIDALIIDPNGVYVDVTFGGGGHSKEILKRLTEKGKLISFDQDPDAIKNKINDRRFSVINSNFQYMNNFIRNLGIIEVDGIIADLGISSHQIDNRERGFSYRFNSKLDMRMDKQSNIDAYKIVNTYSSDKLSTLFSTHGDFKNSFQISELICSARDKKNIETTFELNKILEPIFPKSIFNKILSRVYQSLRIEVNNEIDTLKLFLTQSSEILKKYGRLCVITYHSIEDRIVKRYFNYGNFTNERSKDFYGKSKKILKKINPLITPCKNEIKQNIRARSSKLRVAEKL